MIVNELIEEYCCQHSSEETALLKQLNRDTHAKVLMPRMLSGHLQGEFLKMISHMIKPASILEIGTYTGYSTLCLAEGLQENGKITTIDKNEEIETFTRSFFEKSSQHSKINYLLGNALNIIPTLTETFDLIFIDADKANNEAYYEMCLPKLKQGGFIFVDNVLWSGKVLDSKKDKDSATIDAFNKKIATDTRVEKMLLPLRDGIFLIRKK